ncbi:response regulator [Haladaptatus sp. NG-WS-4]
METNIRVLHVDPLDDTGVSPSELEEVPELAVRTANDEKTVLDEVTGGTVDCIVSGYELPDGTGVTLLERVRDRHSTLPFVPCTTSSDERIASDAIAANVSGYVPDQTDGDRLGELIKVVERAVADARQPRERLDRYKSIVQAMGDGVYTLNTEGKMTAVNDTLTEMSGYDRDDSSARTSLSSWTMQTFAGMTNSSATSSGVERTSQSSG